MILSICDNADVLSVIRLVKIVIKIIKIVVPIILIISLMINYARAVKEEDELSKFNKSAINKIIAVIFIFFIPSLVGIIANISSNDKGYLTCIKNATDDNIKRIRQQDKEEKELREKLAEEKRQKEEEERKRQEEDNKTIETQIPIGSSGDLGNVLGVRYYKQCDSRWGNIQYDIGGGPNGTPATLCSSSCGYTSFAMIAAGLNNDDTINPYTIVKSMRNITDGQLSKYGYGSATDGELTESRFISKFHLKAEQIDPSTDKILQALNDNKPLIIAVSYHYMVLSKSANGNIVLMDPFVNWEDGRGRSGEYENLDYIYQNYGSLVWAAAYERE